MEQFAVVVIRSLSPVVILSEAKDLDFVLGVNRAKNQSLK